jgi:hypothetical protein
MRSTRLTKTRPLVPLTTSFDILWVSYDSFINHVVERTFGLCGYRWLVCMRDLMRFVSNNGILNSSPYVAYA